MHFDEQQVSEHGGQITINLSPDGRHADAHLGFLQVRPSVCVNQRHLLVFRINTNTNCNSWCPSISAIRYNSYKRNQIYILPPSRLTQVSSSVISYIVSYSPLFQPKRNTYCHCRWPPSIMELWMKSWNFNAIIIRSSLRYRREFSVSHREEGWC